MLHLIAERVVFFEIFIARCYLGALVFEAIFWCQYHAYYCNFAITLHKVAKHFYSMVLSCV